MKLWNLLRARGVNEATLFLIAALLVGAMEVLTEIVALWAVALPDEGPASEIGVPGYLVLLVVLYFGRLGTLARVASWFSGVAANIRRSLLEKMLRIEPMAWERLSKDAMRQALSVLPSRLNSIAGNIAGAISLSVNAFFITVYVTWLYWPIGVAAILAYLAIGAYLAHLSGPMTESELTARHFDETLRTGLSEMAYGRKELILDPRKADLLFADAIAGTIEQRRVARAPARKFLIRHSMAFDFIDPVLMIVAVLSVTVVPRAPGDVDHIVAMMAAYILPFGMFRIAAQIVSGEAAASQLEEIEETLDSAAATSRPAARLLASAAASEATDDAAFESITLRDVTYSYADSRNRFRAGPLNLTIEQGTITFVSGENGSGKSTLVKLLIGLYPPRSGTTLLNGVPADMRQHRRLFAFVAADHYLFEYLFGYRDVDDGRVNALLHEYGVGRVTRYVEGRFTRLDLSTGQKKRVGLAVAQLESKPVLVLDEWAAEQDPPMRERFYREILPALRDAGRTIIAITHDERYVDACDQLVLVRDGHIRYAGPPLDAAAIHSPNLA